MIMEKIEILKSVFVFQGLDESLLGQLAAQFKEARFAAGKIIFAEGAAADAFYIVEAGEVGISKRIDAQREKLLAAMGPGSVFGEMAFFAASPRTATATARTGTVLLTIGREDFMGFIVRAPDAGIRILSGLLQVSMDRLEQTSRELVTVYRTGTIIASGQTLAGIIRAVQDELLFAIPRADSGATFIYNEFNDEYEPLAAPEGTAEIPPSAPIIASAASEPSGIVANDTSALPFAPEKFLSGARSVLISPVLKSSRLLGFIAVWNSKITGAFNNSHRLLLSAVAGQIAEAVENIKHQEEERNRMRLKTGK